MRDNAITSVSNSTAIIINPCAREIIQQEQLIMCLISHQTGLLIHTRLMAKTWSFSLIFHRASKRKQRTSWGVGAVCHIRIVGFMSPMTVSSDRSSWSFATTGVDFHSAVPTHYNMTNATLKQAIQLKLSPSPPKEIFPLDVLIYFQHWWLKRWNVSSTWNANL